jgi:hypothetical protein
MQTQMTDFFDLERMHLWDKDAYHNKRCAFTMKLVSDDGTYRVSKCGKCGMRLETSYGMTHATTG